MGKSYPSYQYYTPRSSQVQPVDEDLVSPAITEPPPRTWADWERDCLNWRGMVLMGEWAHWCPDWHDLPMDETCPEWPCTCAETWASVEPK